MLSFAHRVTAFGTLLNRCEITDKKLKCFHIKRQLPRLKNDLHIAEATSATADSWIPKFPELSPLYNYVHTFVISGMVPGGHKPDSWIITGTFLFARNRYGNLTNNVLELVPAEAATVCSALVLLFCCVTKYQLLLLKLPSPVMAWSGCCVAWSENVTLVFSH